MIQEDDEDVDDCFLRAIIEGTNFNYPSVEAFSLQLKKQLIDIGYIAGICANLTYDGHQSSMEEYARRIAGNMAYISSFTANWLNASLEYSWPKVHQSILQQQLVRVIPVPGLVTNNNLKIVIQLTLPMLEETGSPNYVYQSLIANVADEKFFFEGLRKFCSMETNIYGYKENVHYKMQQMSKYATQLNVTVQDIMKQLYNADNLTAIAYLVKDKMGGEVVISAKNFHGWTILREFADFPWESCPTIQYTKQSYLYGKLHATQTLSYYTKGGFTEVCEIFRFIFFM